MYVIHAPNASDDKQVILNFYKKVHESALTNNDSIIVGDYNYCYKNEMNNSTATWNQSHHHRVTQKLRELNFNRVWSDVHEHHDENTLSYTYRKGTYLARLDRIHTLEKNLNKITKYLIIPCNFSDHRCLQFEIKWGQRPIWGRGLWKLNCTLMDDEEYNNEIRHLLNAEIANRNITHCNLVTQWEEIKIKVKKISIKYGIRKKSEQTNQIKDLDETILALAKALDETPSAENRDRLEEAEAQLRAIKLNQYEGARIRARLIDLKEDERAGSFFFNKEKERGEQSSLTALRLPDGSTVDDQDAILTQVADFYGDLYKDDALDINDVERVSSEIHGSIDMEDNDALNADITKKEIVDAVKSCKGEKSPGDDGLPAEFYKKFLDQIITFLLPLYNGALFFGSIPDSFKRAVVKLLYKKGDAKNLKNWRPISLLNTDYKILSKILNNRLKPFLSKIIPLEQKCGVDGRNLSDAIRNIVHLKENLQKSGGYLVALDQSKAFDRVSHQYLFRLLHKLGIKDDFLELTKNLYKNISSRVMINGRMTDVISIEKSVRQGCPYSMTLFIISTIPLLNMLKNSQEIHGYRTPRGNRVKVQAYADDTTIIIKQPKEYNSVLEIYDSYARASGSSLNEDKTEILKLGPAGPSNQNSFLSKLQPSIKILGTQFHPNSDTEQELNLEKAILKVQKFRQQDYILSLKGRILKINTFILSLLWHKAYIIKEKHSALKRLIREIQKYLDPLCGAKIYDQVVKPIKNGGLGLINIKERIIAIKYFTILKSKDHIPEADDIIYELGTRCLKVFGDRFAGPSSFNRNSSHEDYYSELFKLFKDNKIKFNNKTKPKDIEAQIKKDNSIAFKQLFGSKDPRLISINYVVAYRLLPIWSGNDCVFCQRIEESYKHLFIECGKIHMIRNKILNLITPIEPFDFNILSIYYMEGIKNISTHIVISYYKRYVWHYRERLRSGSLTRSEMDYNVMWKKIESEIRFFLQHLNDL